MQQLELRAEGYLELEMPEHALDTLARLGGFVNFSPHVHRLHGEALRMLQRYQEALVPLEQAARLDPEDVHVWLAIGWCRKRTGRIDLAVEAMEHALELDSTEALIHYNLACYLALAGQKQRALSHLSRALKIDPKYRALVDEESDFDPLRSDPGFQALTSIIV